MKDALDALCSVPIPIATNEAARRGFMMALNEDGTINTAKLKEYYEQRLENDEAVWKWLSDSQKAVADFYNRRGESKAADAVSQESP